MSAPLAAGSRTRLEGRLIGALLALANAGADDEQLYRVSQVMGADPIAYRLWRLHCAGAIALMRQDWQALADARAERERRRCEAAGFDRRAGG